MGRITKENKYERGGSMANYQPPISVIFIWHPEDNKTITPVVEYCYSLLSRDVSKPFSRSMNMPIFFRTSNKKGVPTKINILSYKTVIFIFLSKEIASDDSWVDYIKNIPKGDNVSIIPIALDDTAYSLNNILDNVNFIRAYDFEQAYFNEYLFISVTHEIYRYSLNESFEKINLGKDNALKIFLSHAKDGKNGVKLAKALKDFIDNSAMRNFFDATDIACGYKFDEEIIGYIGKSSIIAIHSDEYSSRYWCQREILSAKKQDRPIIAVDTLEEYEDRRFPFASNVPGIHVHIDGEPAKKDLLRILSSCLLETVRFLYAKLLLEQYKQVGWIRRDVEIRSRPPEVSDIDKMLLYNGDSITHKYKSIVYPEPPLYAEEISFLSKLGIKVSTPLTFDVCSLQGKNVGISISEVSEEELISLGQNSSHLVQLSQDIARHLLARGATLIYGGDLREDGFTKFIFNEAQVLQARTKSQDIHINNYIAWPIYKNDTIDIKTWKAKYRTVASMIEIPPADDIRDLIHSGECFLPPTNIQNLYVWSRCLTEMRKKMIEACDVRICAGGRHCGYKGRMPGVLEEIIIAVDRKIPIFLLGGFGGVTASVCQLIQNKIIPDTLTEEWQIQHNSGYREILNFYSSRGKEHLVDYTSIVNYLKDVDLCNGLTKEDNERLFCTPFIEEAIYLIFKGIKAIFKNQITICESNESQYN